MKEAVLIPMMGLVEPNAAPSIGQSRSRLPRGSSDATTSPPSVFRSSCPAHVERASRTRRERAHDAEPAEQPARERRDWIERLARLECVVKQAGLGVQPVPQSRVRQPDGRPDIYLWRARLW